MYIITSLKIQKIAMKLVRRFFGLAKTFENQVMPINTNDLIPYFFDQNVFFKNSYKESTSISLYICKIVCQFMIHYYSLT